MSILCLFKPLGCCESDSHKSLLNNLPWSSFTLMVGSLLKVVQFSWKRVFNNKRKMQNHSEYKGFVRCYDWIQLGCNNYCVYLGWDPNHFFKYTGFWWSIFFPIPKEKSLLILARWEKTINCPLSIRVGLKSSLNYTILVFELSKNLSNLVP